MAALRLANPDDLSIDFHSHTSYSHDANKWFTTERNRAWHTAAGFDVAYVSDHKSTAGAIEGARGNASHHGETILLPSLESRDHSEHVIVLGVDTTVAPDAKGEWHDPVADSLHRPILVLTVPGHLSELPPNEVSGVARTMAIELSDGAPKGINVLQRDPQSIYALARRLDLALVAGSDNHGWGSTAVGWSVMRIPGWRAMSATALDSAIQQTIRTQRSRAGRVYVRDAPDPGRSVALLSLTLPAVIWRMLVDLTWAERVSWLCWIVAAVSIASVPSSRAARDTTLPAARRKPETA
jgi:predicted metal-dependent phosphoesterase TrpH